MGKTSLWMFPIYGMAALIKPLYRRIQNFPLLLRASVYSFLIFIGEYVSGSILKKYDVCPWNYSKARTNIKGVIRLDFTPCWMVAGLIYEKILCRKK